MKKDLLHGYKEKIVQFLISFLHTKQKHYAAANIPQLHIFDRLQKYLMQGKMIRGSLVLFAYDVCAGTHSDDALKIAAALELMQAALLIHDDIMDQDLLRRGEPSMHAQFMQQAPVQKKEIAARFGENIAMCVGDICFFQSFDLLTSGNFSSDLQKKMTSIYTEELIKVGFGQIQDVSFSMTDYEPTITEIETVYRYKTARYTFSLPLSLGALAAGQTSKIIKVLEKLGEQLGMLFQIKDDYLGIFGNFEQTGKPIGGDISENKKTMYRHYLLQKAYRTDLKRIILIFGSQKLRPQDLQFIQQQLITLGIVNELEAKMSQLLTTAEKLINTLPISVEYKNQFTDFAQFLMLRKN